MSAKTPPGLALLAALALLSACGGDPGSRRSDTWYDNNTLKAPGFSSKEHTARYRQAVAKTVKERPVTLVEDGKARRLAPADVGKLPLLPLAAIHSASNQTKGSQRDVLFSVDKRRHPVSLRVDQKGAIRVIPGPAWTPDRSRAPTAPIRGLLKGKWEDGLAADMALGFGMTPKAELELLAGITLHRVKGKRGTEGGKYLANQDGHRIEIYDQTAEARERGFAGPPTRPLPRSLLTLFHEFGHGISAFASLESVRRYNRSVKVANASKGAARERAGKRLKDLERQVNALKKTNPVLSAYQRALGKDLAPTLYGETSLEESFAESYALFRGHPEVLERLRPKVHAWFKGGGHLKAVRDAVAKLPDAL